MPTARELLEQADALMRRNRQAADAAGRAPGAVAPIPVAESRPAITPPATVPNGPAQARTAPVTAVPPAARPDDADIPVLDETVAGANDAEADDVPLLVDAVDEIEVSAPPVDEGEPSDWLEAPSGDDSVLGPAPPSVVVVPPVAVSRTGLGETAPPSRAWRGEAPGTGLPFAAQAGVPEGEGGSSGTFELAGAGPTVGGGASAPGDVARVRLSDIEDLAESGMADLDPDVTWTRPIHARSPVVAPAESARPLAGREPADDGTREMIAAAQDAADVMTASPAIPAGAEWDALAEEIRMQVLQRIDMFTDTGLRERLGERLKPIVDRASADLVATINQHVGELLRAYVAEAIEREIERWRAGR
ncbi:hypothetical protein BURK1_03634 [Burkholderiales bacterium]|nr:hypothetical protein BURK1_03634 [Burkholderiales bacterium]